MPKQEKSDTNEVKALQREAEQLRSQRKRARSAPAAAEPVSEPEEPAREVAAAAAPDVGTTDGAAGNEDSEWGEAVREFSSHLDNAAKEIQQAVREHPGLALLTVFAGGALVGHLYTRR